MNRIRQLRESRGWSQRELGRRINSSGSQIRKLETGERQLTQHWMDRIARVLGCEPGDLLPGADENGRPGVGEADLVAYDAGGETAHVFEVKHALYPGSAERNDVHVMEVRSDAMELAGFFPGDGIVIDLALGDRARDGDIVSAQVYAKDGMTAESVLRRFVPPFLVAESRNPHHRRPLLVDNDRVKILAVVARFSAGRG